MSPTDRVGVAKHIQGAVGWERDMAPGQVGFLEEGLRVTLYENWRSMRH